jgi:preprotein translocase subunit Sec61beta
MDNVRLAPTAGIAACLAVILVLAIPYAIIDSNAVGTYYSSGALNPLFAGLFAIVGIIIFAAGREKRSDPELTAGIGLVFGVFVLGYTIFWAVTVEIGVVYTLTSVSTFRYHRYVLPLTALAIPLCAIWYARALRLF